MCWQKISSIRLDARSIYYLYFIQVKHRIVDILIYNLSNCKIRVYLIGAVIPWTQTGQSNQASMINSIRRPQDTTNTHSVEPRVRDRTTTTNVLPSVRHRTPALTHRQSHNFHQVQNANDHQLILSFFITSQDHASPPQMSYIKWSPKPPPHSSSLVSSPFEGIKCEKESPSFPFRTQKIVHISVFAASMVLISVEAKKPLFVMLHTALSLPCTPSRSYKRGE